MKINIKIPGARIIIITLIIIALVGVTNALHTGLGTFTETGTTPNPGHRLEDARGSVIYTTNDSTVGDFWIIAPRAPGIAYDATDYAIGIQNGSKPTVLIGLTAFLGGVGADLIVSGNIISSNDIRATGDVCANAGTPSEACISTGVGIPAGDVIRSEFDCQSTGSLIPGTYDCTRTSANDVGITGIFHQELEAMFAARYVVWTRFACPADYVILNGGGDCSVGLLDNQLALAKNIQISDNEWEIICSQDGIFSHRVTASISCLKVN